MRVGVFGDVHGHLDELKRTLALFETLKVDQIVCAGDLVDKGRDTETVIDLMREQAIICIQGNHDAKATRMWFTQVEPLRETSIDYLANLPECLNFEWEGVAIYLCHANPWFDPSVYVYPTRPAVLFQLVADAVEAQVIILGHTHHPMCVQSSGKTIVNPGSIYGNRDRLERTCGVLTLPNCSFELYNIDNGQPLAF